MWRLCARECSSSSLSLSWWYQWWWWCAVARADGGRGGRGATVLGGSGTGFSPYASCRVRRCGLVWVGVGLRAIRYSTWVKNAISEDSLRELLGGLRPSFTMVSSRVDRTFADFVRFAEAECVPIGGGGGGSGARGAVGDGGWRLDRQERQGEDPSSPVGSRSRCQPNGNDWRCPGLSGTPS